jgi:hypothetical protein
LAAEYRPCCPTGQRCDEGRHGAWSEEGHARQFPSPRRATLDPVIGCAPTGTAQAIGPSRGRLVRPLTFLLITALLLAAAAPVAATGPAISSPQSAEVGRRIEVKGTNFARKASVQLAWNGSTSGMPKARADHRGAFTVSLRVPLTAS